MPLLNFSKKNIRNIRLSKPSFLSSTTNTKIPRLFGSIHFDFSFRLKYRLELKINSVLTEETHASI